MAEGKAAPITSGKQSKVAVKAQKSKGFVNVKYSREHGNNEKGAETIMHSSTAHALAAHGILEVGEAVKTVKKPKR